MRLELFIIVNQSSVLLVLSEFFYGLTSISSNHLSLIFLLTTIRQMLDHSASVRGTAGFSSQF